MQQPNVISILLQVFHIGKCSRCDSHLNARSMSTIQLFFTYICSILEYMKHHYPHLQCIMWDDMFRETETDVIKGKLSYIFIGENYIYWGNWHGVSHAIRLTIIYLECLRHIKVSSTNTEVEEDIALWKLFISEKM